MTTTCRIGVIGLGQRIAHVLAAMKEVGWDLRLDGYVDPAPIGLPILEDAGILHGGRLPDVQTLIADGPYDLLMIGSPNHLHLEHLKLALAAGCPVFSEKPIVRTMDESYELAALLAARETPPLYIGLGDALDADRARGDRAGRRRRIGRADLDGRHRAPAPRARRLSGAKLAAQTGVGRLVSAGQGLP